MQLSIGWNARICLVVLATWCCLSGPVEARPKTDRVTLANGDTVSGEIKDLQNGYLRYSTDSMGTVMVEWGDVRALDSEHFFRIRTHDGVRFFGAIDQAATPGWIAILHAEGVEEYPVTEIVAIRPIESSVRERLDMVVSAGYSDFKASDSSTTSLGLNMSYADAYSTNKLQARSVVSDNNGSNESSARVDAVRQKLWNNPRHFTYYGANWESNDDLAVDNRVGLALGMGRHFIDSNRTHLAITGGIQGLAEENSLGESTESIEGLVAIQFDTWRFSAPELNLTSLLRMYPGITESGRFRADGNITLSWEIVDDFNLNVSAFGNFDNETSRDGDDFDYGITTGVEWEL